MAEVRAPVASIANIEGIAGAVFGEAWGGTDLGPLLGALVPLRTHVKEQVLLHLNRTEAAEQAQGHAIGGRVPLHGEELLGGLPVQGDAGGRLYQVAGKGLGIGEVPQ